MCSPTKKHLLDIFGAGPDLESAEVDYTEVEVSTLDPHRGNKLSSLYGLCLGATLGLLVLPDTGLVLAPGNARVVLCVRDSLLPVVLLNLAGAVAPVLLFLQSFFLWDPPIPTYTRSVWSRAPSWSCGSKQKAACCEIFMLKRPNSLRAT